MTYTKLWIKIDKDIQNSFWENGTQEEIKTVEENSQMRAPIR